MRVKKKNPLTEGDLGQRVLSAISSVKKYKYRSAMGLSDQMKLPVEMVEYVLVELAQKGKIRIGVGPKGQIWAGFGEGL